MIIWILAISIAVFILLYAIWDWIAPDYIVSGTLKNGGEFNFSCHKLEKALVKLNGFFDTVEKVEVKLYKSEHGINKTVSIPVVVKTERILNLEAMLQ